MLVPSLVLNRVFTEASSLLSPIKDIFTYALPSQGLKFSNAWEVKTVNDESLNSRVSLNDRVSAVEEIKKLAMKSGLDGDIAVYASDELTYSSFGGRFSFTKPVILVPAEHLWRNENRGAFGAQTDEEALVNDTWRYTDQETQFLILRQMARIKKSDSLLKLAARVVMVAAVVLLFLGPVTWVVSLSVFATALLFYFFIERVLHTYYDQKACKLSGKTDDAISALEKQQKQNLYYKSQSRSANFLINSKGDERFNLSTSSLSTRIERLKKLQLGYTRSTSMAPTKTE